MSKFGRLITKSPALEQPRTTRIFSDKSEFVDYAYDSLDIIDKTTLVRWFCRGKDVLDLGCIDHSYEIALGQGDDWLHNQIKQVSTSLVGLDILADDAMRLNENGYDIVCGNAESFDLNRTFDVIVAGDLIEHLSNIGLFLKCLANHMHRGSIAIVTTPNPFNIEQTMLGLFDGKIVVNNQHTVWLDPKVIYELVERSGLRLVDFYWVDTRFKLRLQRKFFGEFINGISEILMRARPLFRRDYAVLLSLADT